MSDPKYPDITVQLTGNDGNAYAILGAMSEALKRGLPEQGLDAAEVKAEVAKFNEEATSGDYNNLLTTCMDWVDVR